MPVRKIIPEAASPEVIKLLAIVGVGAKKSGGKPVTRVLPPRATSAPASVCQPTASARNGAASGTRVSISMTGPSVGAAMCMKIVKELPQIAGRISRRTMLVAVMKAAILVADQFIHLCYR